MKLTDPEIYGIQEALRDVHGNIDRHEFARAIEAAVLAVHPPAAQWIALSKQLPPLGEHVIVALLSGKVIAAASYTRCMGWQWEDAGGESDLDVTITHWMPLPLAPT